MRYVNVAGKSVSVIGLSAAELPLDAADDRQLTEASDQFRPTRRRSAVRRRIGI